MTDNVILVEKKDGVAIITLNRPEVMNAFNFPMLQALKAEIEAVRIQPEIRV
ncbi:MAG: enoyl-CoA hydratase, partial [Deltaproteobacteria bacterium]|nr:enoyl-CoA hydratase [Deltaproteobacteria bacterium]